MTAMLRLVDLAMSMAPTQSPSPLPSRCPTFRPSQRPSMRPSVRPTMVPGSRATLVPDSHVSTRHTDAPSTKRSATLFPRFDAATQHDARRLIAALELNVTFLESVLRVDSSPLALAALADIRHDIGELEMRFALAPSTPSLLVRHA